MFIRKIGKFVRGRATPAQILMASVLGCMLGFIPGFAQGPGLVVALTLLLIVLNANLFVAGLAGLAAKALSLLLMPVSFAVGRVLLDGPTGGFFAAMINAPVLALFGFEHYATTGGIVLGLATGLALGLLVTKLLSRFRRLMAGLDETSPRFAAVTRTWWAKLLAFLFIGKGAAPGKEGYEKILAKKVGNPVRPMGAGLAVVAAGMLFAGYRYFSDDLVTSALRRGLQRANGATVDVGGAELDLRAGKLSVTGFAMADPDHLDRDLLRAAHVEADVSGADLLRKRLAMDRLVLSGAATGQPRAVPGERIGSPPEPSPPPDPRDIGEDWKKLEEYLRQAEVWKERLARARRVLERVATSEEPEAAPQTHRERLEQQVREHGYAKVRADHLVEGAPRFAIYELLAENVQVAQVEGETVTIRGRNLSTQPHLLDEPPYLKVESSRGRFGVEVGREPSATAGAGDAPALGGAGRNVLAFHFKGIPAERVVGQLASTEPQLSGGTVDLEASGSWTAGAPIAIDLPLSITLRDTQLSIGGSGPTPIKRLVFPVAVRGPLDNPAVRVDERALADALVAAGADELAGRVRGEAQEKVDEALKKATDQVGEKLGGEAAKKLPADAGESLKKGLDDILGGKKKEGG